MPVRKLLINADPVSVEQVTAELEKIYPEAAIEEPEDLAGRISDTVALQQRTWLLIALAAGLAGAVAFAPGRCRAGRILLAGDDVREALGVTRRQRRGSVACS